MTTWKLVQALQTVIPNGAYRGYRLGDVLLDPTVDDEARRAWLSWASRRHKHKAIREAVDVILDAVAFIEFRDDL